MSNNNPSTTQQTAKKLSRTESKAATRQRLLDAGFRLMLEEGITGLSMNKVSKMAGIAQPSFYTHFKNLNELIDELAKRLKNEFLYPAQQALIAVFSTPNREDNSVVLKRLFKLLVEGLFANEFLLQQALERHQSHSAFGKHVQSFYADLKQEWLDFLTQNSQQDISTADKDRYSMVIDCIFAMMETLVVGLSRGEYENKEAIVDILAEFTINHFGDLIDNVITP